MTLILLLLLAPAAFSQVVPFEAPWSGLPSTALAPLSAAEADPAAFLGGLERGFDETDPTARRLLGTALVEAASGSPRPCAERLQRIGLSKEASARLGPRLDSIASRLREAAAGSLALSRRLRALAEDAAGAETERLAFGPSAAPAAREPLLDPADPRSVRLLHERGELSAGQAVTALLRWSAREDLGPLVSREVEVGLLGPDGKVSSEAAEILRRPPERAASSLAMEGSSFEDFAALLALLPESERSFRVLEIPAGRSFGPLEDAHQALESAMLAYEYQRPPWITRGSSFVVVPSFGMLQASLDVRFGPDAARLRPTAEAAEEARVHSDLARAGRTFGVHYPGSGQEEEGDGYHLGRFFYSMHDYFHAHVASRSPAAFRRLVPAILDCFRSLLAKLETRDGPETWRRLRAAVARAKQQLEDGVLSALDARVLPMGTWLSQEAFRIARGTPLGETDALAALGRHAALHPELWPFFSPSEFAEAALDAHDAAVLGRKERLPPRPEKPLDPLFAFVFILALAAGLLGLFTAWVLWV